MRIAMVLAGCVLVSCASGRSNAPGDDAGPGSASDSGVVVPVLGTLSIDPPSRELVITNGLPTRATFTATLTAPDGTPRDVTAETRFQIDAAYGSFTANQLTINVATKTRISAAYADKVAFADLTARLKSVRVDPSLPSTTPALFDHPDTAQLAPLIVYPPADTVMPRNLGDFEIHWTDGHANNVFEVSLRTELSDVRVYVRGNNGLPSQGTTPSWTAFSATEWLAAVGDEDAVTYQVRGANAATPGSVGAGPARTALLSNEVMDGGLYYWANATNLDAPVQLPIGIFRHDMNKPGEVAEEYITTNQTRDRCVACHVLSRDGKKMAITYQDPPARPGPAAMVDVETQALGASTQRWSFGTFTPDNAQFLAVDQGTLVVRDATSPTQPVLATMVVDPPTMRVTHPDLSPDGTQLVYVRFLPPQLDFDFGGGKVYRRSYDAATRTFGPEIAVVNDNQNNFYPTWSPDGAWILFNKNLAGSAYDDRNSVPWVVKADGSRPPVQLAKATQQLGTDSWPRWAPFPQTLGVGNEPMYWITLSSKRDFGVRLRNTGVPHRGGQRAQIWMTPFFPRRAAEGQDPSAPAFRLPFQNLESSNHIAQWTERIVVVIQ
jgi:hypothetical protein